MARRKSKYKNLGSRDNVNVFEIERGVKYSARIRIQDGVGENGKPKWKWSARRTFRASGIPEAFAKGFEYKQELERGDIGIDKSIAEYARGWHDARIRQSEASGVPAKRTIDRDEIDVRRIEAKFPNTTVRKLTPEKIEAAIEELRAEGVSENSIHRTVSRLKFILRKPVAAGYLPYNPCDLVTTVTKPKVSRAYRDAKRIEAEDAPGFIRWLNEQELDGRTVALWIGVTEHVRLGEALGLTWKDVDFERNAIHIRGMLNKDGKLVKAKADSEGTLGMGTILKSVLYEWRDAQRAAFPTMVKKMGRREVFCGREWDDSAPVCATYYGSFDSEDAFGKWMRHLMARLGLGEFTEQEHWVDSKGKKRIKYKGYVGPSYKSLRSYGASLLVVEKGMDVKSVQGHTRHRLVSTLMDIYVECVSASEREVTQVIDEHVRAILGGEVAEARTLESFERIVREDAPETWPGWVRELAQAASAKLQG